MDENDKECSFVPQINPISASLACRSSKEQENENVWESLYKLDEQRRQWLEQKARQAQLEKEQNEPEIPKAPQKSKF